MSLTVKKGFTIIEIVLVLAIAGLIFLAVFVALPNLQRSQRDAQRRRDLTQIHANVVTLNAATKTNLWANNSAVNSKIKNNVGYGIVSLEILSDDDPLKNDPSGFERKVYVTGCRKSSAANVTEGEPCPASSTIKRKTGNNDEYEQKFLTSGRIENLQKYLSDYLGMVFVILNASCDGSTVIYKQGAKNFATVTALESGDQMCLSSN